MDQDGTDGTADGGTPAARSEPTHPHSEPTARTSAGRAAGPGDPERPRSEGTAREGASAGRAFEPGPSAGVAGAGESVGPSAGVAGAGGPVRPPAEAAGRSARADDEARLPGPGEPERPHSELTARASAGRAAGPGDPERPRSEGTAREGASAGRAFEPGPSAGAAGAGGPVGPSAGVAGSGESVGPSAGGVGRSARADGEARRSARPPLLRRTLAALLVALTALCALASVVGVWGARTALNTDRWVAAVGPLPEDPAVNAAVSTYLTDEIFNRLEVADRLSGELPERVSFLAAPVSGTVHDYLRKSVSELLATERFEDLWRAANRAAHARIVAVLQGRAQNVHVQGDTVTLDLLPLVNNLLTALEDRLPTLFGKKLDLPTLTSGEIPPDLHARIEKALGVPLPDDFAHIKIYDGDELARLQQAVLLVRRGLVGLLAGTVLLAALALWISPGRRRSVLQLGLWLVVGTVALSAVLRAVRGRLLGRVPEGVYREGASEALRTVLTTLRDRGDQLLWCGAALALLAYLVGPGRLPVALRRHTAQGVQAAGRRLTEGDGARAWIRRHADGLRVGGVVVAALCALPLSSWTGLLVVAVLLAAYETAVSLLARGHASPTAGEVPPAPPEETGAAR
ncbi:hypothetical protein GCM10010129_34780 [Streptomyces fumigatiscleroticus]|nr:hypothetical protein GCM10010129_34780 [Streptomyces fumigatiscleroticus]